MAGEVHQSQPVHYSGSIAHLCSPRQFYFSRKNKGGWPHQLSRLPPVTGADFHRYASGLPLNRFPLLSSVKGRCDEWKLQIPACKPASYWCSGEKKMEKLYIKRRFISLRCHLAVKRKTADVIPTCHAPNLVGKLCFVHTWLVLCLMDPEGKCLNKQLVVKLSLHLIRVPVDSLTLCT